MPEYISWTTRVVVAGQQFRKQQAVAGRHGDPHSAGVCSVPGVWSRHGPITTSADNINDNINNIQINKAVMARPDHSEYEKYLLISTSLSNW